MEHGNSQELKKVALKYILWAKASRFTVNTQYIYVISLPIFFQEAHSVIVKYSLQTAWSCYVKQLAVAYEK